LFDIKIRTEKNTKTSQNTRQEETKTSENESGKKEKIVVKKIVLTRTRFCYER